MRTTLKKLLCITFISLYVVGTLFSKERIDTTSNSGTSVNTNKIMALCAMPTSRMELDINNVRAMVLNGGDMWWDESDARYEIPKIDDPKIPKKHSIFAGAIWIGGVDPGGNLYVAAQRYRQSSQKSYWPGPLNDVASITADECLTWDQHFKINKTDIDDFTSSYTANIDWGDIPDVIKKWPGKNNPYLAENDNDFQTTLNQNLAPFFDKDCDGNYDPRLGDLPDIEGDQAIWWVMNDVGDIKVGMEPENAAIGLEIQIMAFAFATNDLINNMTFYKQVLMNKGNITLNNTYLGQWVDPDLGQFDDDYVGCDVARGLGICYNGDEDDEGVHGYGENPPAVGVDFFRGPFADPNDGIDNNRNGEVDEPGELISMSNFLYYNNNADIINGAPDKGIHYYNYLRNIWKNGSLCVYDGGDGVEDYLPNPIQNPVPTNFMFPGNSDPDGWGVGGTDSIPKSMPFWDENSAGNTPADRRFVQSAGPFTLKPGAVNELTIGVVWARVNKGGSTGSLGLLKVADDMAQQLFDNNFSLLNGPNAPDILITELDKELILSLVQDTFTIGGGNISICDTTDTLTSTSNEFTTESYVEVDNSLVTLGAKDKAFRFQGYLIYQVKDATVKAADLGDPDRARLVIQMDIKDGVGDLINEEFDPDVNAFVPLLKVSGADKGIAHTIRVNKDLFASGDPTLVNFKTYYFLAIAYGANTDIKNKTQYLAGRLNIGVKGSGTPYPAIPHKTEPENDGTVLNSSYGTDLEITRIHGTGNGGKVLDLAVGEADKILKNNSVDSLTYAAGSSPLNIKVYDPVGVKEGNFTLKLSSRLVYSKASATGSFSVGDTIVCTEPSPFKVPSSTKDANIVNQSSYQVLQIPGKAIIKRIFESDLTTTLDVEMLNDETGGTFVMEFDTTRIKIDPAGNAVEVFIGYKTKPMPFVTYRTIDTIIGGIDTNIVIDTISATCTKFVLHDYWHLTDENNDTIHSQRTITEFDEQLVPAYGFSIQLKHTNNPNYRIEDDRNNGFQEATIEFDDQEKIWLEAVKNDEVEWLMSGGAVGNDNGYDPGEVYRGVLDGSWASYAVTRTVTDSGVAYFTTKPKNTVHFLNNVDVIITDEKSKWTKVTVLQVGHFCGTSKNQLRLLKSDNTSIDINGDSVNLISDYDSMPSTGMGWFPGYAIDIDKGIRLNMMFSESFKRDPDNGDNLIWEPTSDIDGGRSYIYIMNSKYDEGKKLEYVFDSIINKYLNPVNCFPVIKLPNGIKAEVFDHCIWAGSMKLNSDFSLWDKSGNYQIPTDVKIRLRVNRYYTSYSQNSINHANPEYFFSTKKLISTTNDLNTAKSALDLIRVVPNPYYAFSNYETSQLDNRIKFTNLPQKCDITIYTINGTIIRRLRKDDSNTFLDWDLKNQNSIPIGSGAYIIHIDAFDMGEKVLKWFGILRPIDLDTF